LATLPFSFEGKRRMEQAAESLQSLRQIADLVVCFENDRMSSLVDGNARIDEAFASVDALLGQAVRALAALQQRRGVLHTGLDEISSILSGSRSMAWFGHGSASGDDRMSRAFVSAMGSPLLESDWYAHAGGVWVCFSGGDDLRWSEVEAVMREVHSRLPSSTRVFMGAGVDSRMGSEVSVTVIAGATELGGGIDRVEPASAGLARGGVRREEMFMPVQPASQMEPARHQDVPAALIAVQEEALITGGAVSDETRATEPQMPEVEAVYAEESPLSSTGQPLDDEEKNLPPFESQEELRRDVGATLLKRRVAERLAAQAQLSDFHEVSATPVIAPSPQVEPVEEHEPELIPISQERSEPLSQPASVDESKPSVASSSNRSKATVQEQMHFETANRGRFEKTSPTMVDGEDLDVPTFMRQGLHLNPGEDKGSGGTH
jgi:cell division protein FtsZ